MVNWMKLAEGTTPEIKRMCKIAKQLERTLDFVLFMTSKRLMPPINDIHETFALTDRLIRHLKLFGEMVAANEKERKDLEIKVRSLWNEINKSKDEIIDAVKLNNPDKVAANLVTVYTFLHSTVYTIINEVKKAIEETYNKNIGLITLKTLGVIKPPKELLPPIMFRREGE